MTSIRTAPTPPSRRHRAPNRHAAADRKPVRKPVRKSAAVTLIAAAAAIGALAPATAHAAAIGGFPAPFTAADTAQAREAASTPATLLTLSRFFARDGAIAQDATRPHLVGPSVTVYLLDPGFVAGRPGAPAADPQFVASKAVSANGRVASVWTARTAKGWKVVNIATGGDETDYVSKAHGLGTVFREPQIDAWYVVRDGRVLPLDPDARRAVGKGGVSLAAYQRLVHAKYGNKLPGSAYDRAGEGGGYGGTAEAPHAFSAPATTAGAAVTAGVAAAAVATLLGARFRARFGVRRMRRSRHVG
ncbi:hypothetical protein FB563_7116 [Streptomyces puniciscabiei]|uniref:LPXTG-motif cell wall-anchored protein n=1 Tax=Streptomyces puniciscabiei TaxID=164348 RepID=A0A542TJD9_9ACTN|nr:hypothetical protein [Streptomyces puniciscabiei]TQK86950.1 hypothetical protein FB563_7116 [Streptomyces puniciscabiei]